MRRARLLQIAAMQFLIMFLLVTGCAQEQETGLVQIREALGNEEATLVITDSGLGGLAVCADIAEKAKQQRQSAVLHLVFCNALPESDQGYNRMRTAQRKAEVFSDALTGMVRAYHPDALLIACNTLSVVYPETNFSRSTSVPVLGIVDIGVDMLRERLSLRRNSSAIIFGTETTIGSDVHRSRLIASGFSAHRLIPQACPDLAGEIESDAQSERVSAAIELFAEDAVRRLPADTDTVLAGLCCTHYGYCAEQFAAAIRAQSGKAVEIVDPTSRMGELLFSAKWANRYPQTRVTVSVVSRAIITPSEVRSIGSLLERTSPETAAALRQYEVKRDLFPFAAE